MLTPISFMSWNTKQNTQVTICLQIGRANQLHRVYHPDKLYIINSLDGHCRILMSKYDILSFRLQWKMFIQWRFFISIQQTVQPNQFVFNNQIASKKILPAHVQQMAPHVHIHTNELNYQKLPKYNVWTNRRPNGSIRRIAYWINERKFWNQK